MLFNHDLEKIEILSNLTNILGVNSFFSSVRGFRRHRSGCFLRRRCKEAVQLEPTRPDLRRVGPIEPAPHQNPTRTIANHIGCR